MRTRRGRVVMAAILVAGGWQSVTPERSREATAGPAARASHPPAPSLSGRIQAAQAAFYRARTAAARAAVIAGLQQDLAADGSLPDAALAAAKQRYLDRLARLHRGEPRTYPSQATREAWEGVMQAIDGALQARHARGEARK